MTRRSRRRAGRLFVRRQALETNDPWLARLVRQAGAGEEPPDKTDDDSSRERIEALADMICSGGEESSAALFVLMEALQPSSEPKALAHVVKHLAFTRCGELNVFGMVDSQVQYSSASCSRKNISR